MSIYENQSRDPSHSGTKGLASFRFGRWARDLKSSLDYPFWTLRGRTAPDNHVYKKARIRKLAAATQCRSFVETGTFYGQMVNFATNVFDRIISIEIYPPFHSKNAAIFRDDPKVTILLGDSAQNLGQALSLAAGPTLFWLDGHYSGNGTGLGDKVSPIIEELQIIARSDQREHCIVIDDRRLFIGAGGYPTIEETVDELKRINPNYQISFDCDSIVARTV